MTTPPAESAPRDVSTPSGGAADAPPARPVLRVVRGAPTDAELAAVVAVLAAGGGGGGGAPTPEPAAPSRWASRAALVRRIPTPGPGAWRASAGPR